ncbi:MAG TPA: cation:proton antiporter, partial [Gemmatimonadales bacterium]|nr:cation:proton antiporter [Gemmatimonadales bacterium]
MPALDLPLTLPVTNPVLIFALAMVIFLVAPLVAERLRVPGIIGIIVAGVLIGPHGLHLLERGRVIELLGTVGLVYLMFLAGVEMDVHGFRRARARSVGFGVLTFALPLALAAVAAHLLGFAPRTALLLGALFATQTLVAYPLVLRFGILRNEAVTVTVGATIITDVAVLLVLAVVAASVEGALTPVFWARLLVPLAAMIAVVLLVLPAVTRWFFRRSESGGSSEFLFVMAGLFASAVAANAAGVEPIVGAFLAGLAFNTLIPSAGLLANRVRFVGESLFIPFFLLSVGMLVDVRVFLSDLRAWGVMLVLLALAIAGKWGAAEIARRLYGYSADEGRTMFGLSVSHAAATMAVTLVGYDLGIFDDLILNTIVLIILVSCVIGPAVVARAGRRLALLEEQRPYEPSAAPQRILVPLSNPATAPALMDLALLLREPRSTEPLFALTVVPEEGESAAEHVANAEKMLSRAVAYAAGAAVPIQALTRVDQNFASGIARGAVETRTSTVIMGWDGRVSRHRVFGSVLDQVLELSRQQVVVARLGHPLNITRRLVLLVPAGADHESGFYGAAATVKRLARGLGASLVLVSVESDPAPIVKAVQAVRPLIETTARTAPSWSTALGQLRDLLRPDDLVVVLGARPDTVAWHPALARLPARLSALVPESFLVVYPAERVEGAPAAGLEMPRVFNRIRIVADLPGRSTHAALDALLERQYPHDRGRRRDILRVLLHSRRSAALEIAPDVVVVHARFDFLDQSQVFLGRSAAGIALPDIERPARVLFLLLSPADQPDEHLAALADIARVAGAADRLAALRSAGTDAELTAA